MTLAIYTLFDDSVASISNNKYVVIGSQASYEAIYSCWKKNIIYAEKIGDGKSKSPLFFYAIYGSFAMENLTSCIEFGWYLNDFFLNSDERDEDVVINTWTASWNGDME